MNRPSHRAFRGLAPPFRALTVVLLLFVAALPVSAAPQQQFGGSLVGSFCYSWDFLNNTTQDADDLHISLRGVRQVSDVYLGADNPFGEPAPTSGYDAPSDTYRLDFAGGPALDATAAHIGICTDRPVLRLSGPGATPPFYFTSAAAALEPAPLFLGVTWRLSQGQLHVDIHNDQQVPLLLWSLNLFQAEQPLAIDDLNADTFTILPQVAELAPDVITLQPGTTQTFDVPADALSGIAAGQGLLLAAEFSTEDDPGNLGHLYAQLIAPQNTYLPVIFRQ
ncbi:MAG: hypothetical protein ACM30E_09935 [Nitrososphaerales archaeon]